MALEAERHGRRRGSLLFTHSTGTRFAGPVSSGARFHWRERVHLNGKMRIMATVASVLSSALLVSCGDGSAGSPSAEDCVLNNVGSAQTDAAVLAIQRACHDKFPRTQAKIAGATAEHAAKEEAQRRAEAAANAAAAAAANAVGANTP